MKKLAIKLSTFVRPLFDYSNVDDTVAEQAKAAVTTIKALQRGAAVDIGRELIAVKEALGHGKFDAWVEAEFGYSKRTALNMMSVAREIGDDYASIAYLPPAVLYKLAAPSTSSEVRQAVIARAAEQIVDPASVVRLIDDTRKGEVRKERIASRKASLAAQGTKEQREARMEAQRLKDAKIFEEKRQRAEAAVELLRSMLGGRFDELCATLKDVDHWCFTEALSRAVKHQERRYVRLEMADAE